MDEAIPYSDLSALIALAQAAPKPPMVRLEEFEGWLESSRAKRLAKFVYERREPDGPDAELKADFRTVLEMSGFIPAGFAG